MTLIDAEAIAIAAKLPELERLKLKKQQLKTDVDTVNAQIAEIQAALDTQEASAKNKLK